MTDVMTPLQRSRCMSKIQGKNTSPEVRLRKALWAAGLRYRLHAKLPGKPDVVFSGAKVAIFVDGCFWHGCPLHRVMPKSNAVFWATKLGKNVERDRRNATELRRMGWRVKRVWEHQVDGKLERIVKEIESLVSKRRR